MEFISSYCPPTTREILIRRSAETDLFLFFYFCVQVGARNVVRSKSCHVRMALNLVCVAGSRLWSSRRCSGLLGAVIVTSPIPSFLFFRCFLGSPVLVRVIPPLAELAGDRLDIYVGAGFRPKPGAHVGILVSNGALPRPLHALLVTVLPCRRCHARIS